MVKRARDIKTTEGVLGEPKAKAGRTISNEIKEVVEIFFQSDLYSRMCPAKK